MNNGANSQLFQRPWLADKLPRKLFTQDSSTSPPWIPISLDLATQPKYKPFLPGQYTELATVKKWMAKRVFFTYIGTFSMRDTDGAMSFWRITCERWMGMGRLWILYLIERHLHSSAPFLYWGVKTIDVDSVKFAHFAVAYFSPSDTYAQSVWSEHVHKKGLTYVQCVIGEVRSQMFLI